MNYTALIAVAALSLSGCDKAQDKQGGLPPAQEWQAPSADPAAASNPHAANPHAANPHAGDPHGGVGGGGVESLGLPPPDPNRPVDPDKFVAGAITASGPAQAKLTPGAVLFISVKRRNPADGTGMGPPMAVDRLDAKGPSVPFRLTAANAMIAGTDFTGDVVISAWIDQDGDAMTKQPGDAIGTVSATIPADKLALVLSELRP